jgi:hypothetical protein
MDQRPPLHPAWYLVAFVAVAFVANLVVMYTRFGATSQWVSGPCFLPSF